MNTIKRKHYFMDHEQMDFETQIPLGCCHYGATDAGEILATVERILLGDFEQWYLEWLALAERLQGIAEGNWRKKTGKRRGGPLVDRFDLDPGVTLVSSGRAIGLSNLERPALEDHPQIKRGVTAPAGPAFGDFTDGLLRGSLRQTP
jgi:hypothetical protein